MKQIKREALYPDQKPPISELERERRLSEHLVDLDVKVRKQELKAHHAEDSAYRTACSLDVTVRFLTSTVMEVVDSHNIGDIENRINMLNSIREDVVSHVKESQIPVVKTMLSTVLFTIDETLKSLMKLRTARGKYLQTIPLYQSHYTQLEPGFTVRVPNIKNNTT